MLDRTPDPCEQSEISRADRAERLEIGMGGGPGCHEATAPGPGGARFAQWDGGELRSGRGRDAPEFGRGRRGAWPPCGWVRPDAGQE